MNLVDFRKDLRFQNTPKKRMLKCHNLTKLLSGPCGVLIADLILLAINWIWIAWQIGNYFLFKVQSSDFILVQVNVLNVLIFEQNPPAIPISLIAIILKPFKSFKLYIDWHNFSFSILQLKWPEFKKLHYLIQA